MSFLRTIAVLVGMGLIASTSIGEELPGAMGEGVKEAVAAFEKTSRAEPIMDGIRLRFPYGQGVPRIVCAPLRACSVELQAGENVIDYHAGDSDRWLVEIDSYGGGIPYLVVKPVACGLDTNLVVTTDRHFYYLELHSQVCGDALQKRRDPRSALVPLSGFYYPMEAQRQRKAAEAAAVLAAENETKAQVVESRAALSGCQDFEFEWKASRAFPYKPKAICRGEHHTVIVLPAGVADVGTLMEGVGDEYRLVNFQLEDGFLSTDRPIETGKIIINRAGKGRPHVLKFWGTGR